MLDLGAQLRDYVEATIERIDVEDVVGGVSRQPGERPPRWSVRPAWVFTVAALIAIVLVGGPLLLDIGRSSDVADPAAGLTTDQDPADATTPLAGALWWLEATYDGSLYPVLFDGGYAALAPNESVVGDVWVSRNGVRWGPASGQLPAGPYGLASDGETLFAQGDGIWASTTGSDWRQVFTGEEPYWLFGDTGWIGGGSAGEAGAVVFGVDDDVRIAGWVYDGDRFVPADVGGIADLPALEVSQPDVVALGDRFIFYLDDDNSTTLMSMSTTGQTWSDPAPPPAGSPLYDGLRKVASFDGLNLVTTGEGGLWSTADGFSWDRVSFGGAGGEVRAMAAGELGWIIWEHDDGINRLWHSSDTQSWTEIDEIGPFASGGGEIGQVGVGQATLLVGEDDILVFSVVGEIGSGGFGGWVVAEGVTEVWRLQLGSR
ncbi:MAG: hypothetical protein U9N84_12135 [Actinomycetota bacterium]|nr:hypothetical protein [Actinomycetota bacterium]